MAQVEDSAINIIMNGNHTAAVFDHHSGTTQTEGKGLRKVRKINYIVYLLNVL